MISYVLCVLLGLIMPGGGLHQPWLQFLPGFVWLTLPSFLLGLVEVIAYGWYTALIFAPLFNFFVAHRLSGADCESRGAAADQRPIRCRSTKLSNHFDGDEIHGDERAFQTICHPRLQRVSTARPRRAFEAAWFLEIQDGPCSHRVSADRRFPSSFRAPSPCALGFLPFLLDLVCPFLHIFMHGGHGGHGKGPRAIEAVP